MKRKSEEKDEETAEKKFCNRPAALLDSPGLPKMEVGSEVLMEPEGQSHSEIRELVERFGQLVLRGSLDHPLTTKLLLQAFQCDEHSEPTSKDEITEVEVLHIRECGLRRLCHVEQKSVLKILSKHHRTIFTRLVKSKWALDYLAELVRELQKARCAVRTPNDDFFDEITWMQYSLLKISWKFEIVYKRFCPWPTELRLKILQTLILCNANFANWPSGVGLDGRLLLQLMRMKSVPAVFFEVFGKTGGS